MRSACWIRRLRRNAVIALASMGLMALVFRLSGADRSLSFRWSMASGYASVALIGLALVMAPWWLYRRRRVPVSTDIRRDVGLWGAALAMVHVATGLQVHGNGDMLSYFFVRARYDGPSMPLRLDASGLANWAGLAATTLLLFLGVISNDWSMRALGIARWKKLQQSTYAAAVLTVVHGLAYQILDRRAAPFVIVLVVLIALVLAAQLHGRRLHRANDR